jgi:hypothetical protein
VEAAQKNKTRQKGEALPLTGFELKITRTGSKEQTS